MEPRDTSLRDITRRHFFKDVGFGIGSLALTSLMNERLFAASLDAATGGGAEGRDPLRAQGQTGHLPVHGGRAVAAGPVRPQAAAAEARRRGDSRWHHPGGRAVRVRQGHTAAARVAIRVPSARSVGQRDFRAAAVPAAACRRDRDHPFDEDDAVQPRAGADLHEHREPGDWAAQHGLVAQLRPGQRQQGPARVCRPDVRTEQPGRRQELLGQRLPADGAPGRRVPRQGRAGPFLAQPGGRRQPGAARVAGPDSIAQHDREPARRRSGDHHAHRRLRNGVPHAVERARAHRHLGGIAGDARDVRHRAGPGVVWQQLPARAAAGGARRALRPALSPRLGHARRRHRHRHRRARAAALPADRPGHRRAAHGPEAARPAGLDAGHLGRRVRAHARSTRRATGPSSWAATTIRARSRCGWPAPA